MKIKFFWLLFFGIIIAGCKPTNPPDEPDDPDDPDDPPIVAVDSLGVSITTIAFTAEKDASLIVVRTNKSWSATKTADWLSLSATSGNKNTGFLIGASANQGMMRETAVTIRAGDKSTEIKITQASAPKMTITVKGIPLNMILVEGGEFIMGSSEQSSYGLPHRVKLSDFYISETEVTNALWLAAKGTLPYTDHSEADKPTHPVSEANWNVVTGEFIPAFNQLTGKTFRLPTEAEWEYAALGGKKTTGTKYAGSNTLDDVAWYLANSDKEKKAVKGKDPNQLGLYDMSGNVSEWCSDWFDYYYGFQIVNQTVVVPDLQTNPKGPDSGTKKLVRGGSSESDEMWGYSNCHVKYRHSIIPTGIDGCWGNTGNPQEPECNFIKFTGFRLVIPTQNQ